MGEPKLEWSTIQLRMVNQQKIIPLGRLQKVMVDIAGVKAQADFEVIEIVEDADPYPALLGLDWAIYMGGVINLKKCNMVFENNSTRVIVQLDPMEGTWYTEPARDEEEVYHIYKLTTQDEYWINPTEKGVLCWEKDSECFSDSDGELENWQGRLYAVSALRCLRVTRNFRCISSKVRDLPYFGDSGNIKEFLRAFEAEVPKESRLGALLLALCGAPACRWDMHRTIFCNWEECQDKMILQFEAPSVGQIKNFLGLEDPRRYFLAWEMQQCDRIPNERVHLFTHAIGLRPAAWYLDAELHQRTCHWENL